MLRKSSSRFIKKYQWPITFVLGFVIVGAGVVIWTKAAAPTASVESENGTATGNASIVSDSTASSGRAIQFGSVSTGGGTSTVTNGKQINLTNTGYLAWRGPNGETCTDAQLTVYNSQVNASSLGSTATCVWFKGGINIDKAITLNACKVNGIISTNGNKTTINYCTVNPSTPDDWSLGPSNFTAIRSQIMGSSDGVRYGGGTTDTLIENYIRNKQQSPDDHNDGIQAYGATAGGTILRNNIDGNPVGGGVSTSGMIVADYVTGTFEIRDNYFIGGGYTLRFYENAFYKVTGNIVEKNSYKYGPVITTNSRPGAFVEWSNNTLSDGTPINP